MVHGERIGGHLLRRACVPIAHHLGDVELVAGAFHDFAEADMAVTIDRISGQAANFEVFMLPLMTAWRDELRREEDAREERRARREAKRAAAMAAKGREMPSWGGLL